MIFIILNSDKIIYFYIKLVVMKSPCTNSLFTQLIIIDSIKKIKNGDKHGCR